jgi:hypothetical protein
MRRRRLGVAVALAAGIGASIGTSADGARLKWHTPAGAVVLPIEGDLPSLSGAIEWIILVHGWPYDIHTGRLRGMRGPRRRPTSAFVPDARGAIRGPGGNHDRGPVAPIRTEKSVARDRLSPACALGGR